MIRSDVAVVAIGRNEGERLVRCLASLKEHMGRIVYVDSGSTDKSLETAHEAGAEIVELDTSRPFTAARARNAGFEKLKGSGTRPRYVQFVDADCEVQPGWIKTAAAHLDSHPDFAVVCGRRRERFPDASVWNRLIDAEWDSPVGEAKACGGDAMMRTDVLDEVGGFNPGLIAGEEPELCVRIRQAGWRVARLDAEMTLHDANMTRVSQWWKRTRRAGYAYAQGAAMHGRPPERHKVTETRRALLWGAAIPITACLGGLFLSPWAFAILLLWPAQILRLTLSGMSPARATALTFGKIAEAAGALEYWIKRLLNREARLIEYK